MHRQIIPLVSCMLILSAAPTWGEGSSRLAEHARALEERAEAGEDIDGLEDTLETIPDPLEPFNRAMFRVNDTLYFWVLKPTAEGYSALVPERARIGVRRFFSNVATPVRLLNALLQLKLKDAGIELSRFVINTTLGVAGFMDPARDKWKLFQHEEDVGQTMGFYGVGPGFYIHWPFFGPSSLRGTVGLVGDLLLNPTSYLFPNDRLATVGVSVYGSTNEVSLEIGSYEGIKEAALDPYLFTRDAYHQHRESLIKE